MTSNLDALLHVPAAQPFAMLARAARDVLGSDTPDIYERLRMARRREFEALVREAAAHFRSVDPDRRRRILAQFEILAQAQAIANLAENPQADSGDMVSPTAELRDVLSAAP
jgi:hypothetical protein